MAESNSTCNWLCTGDEIFPEMLAAIDAAKKSVCLEVYVFQDSPVGIRFRAALVRACKRGAKVRVLVDGVGSYFLPAHFWDSLRSAGGEVRQFNPVTLKRLIIRNHRKLLVCDGRVAFVGGFNIATEYEGDGVKSGWCDVGLKIEGALVAQLELSFEGNVRARKIPAQTVRAPAQIRCKNNCRAAEGATFVERAGPRTEPVQTGAAQGFEARKKRADDDRLLSADVAAAARFEARGAARRKSADDSRRQIRRAAFPARRAQPVSAVFEGEHRDLRISATDICTRNS
jgi:phosphatidylserine/phosphatidylglycerophosphate/cardiolipin synthase-like enzyme